jgi:hypothetical protein
MTVRVPEVVSKIRDEKTRTLNVLLPGTLTNQGATATYFYNERGTDQLDGMEWVLDTAYEATWRIAGTNQAGIKAEVFNITNRQEQLRSNNVVWCGSGATADCQTAMTTSGRRRRAPRSAAVSPARSRARIASR